MDVLIPAATIAVVVALVQAYKLMGGPSRVAPLLAILFGIALGFLTIQPYDFRQIILQGIVTGLSAAGLYSGARAVTAPSDPATQPLA